MLEGRCTIKNLILTNETILSDINYIEQSNTISKLLRMSEYMIWIIDSRFEKTLKKANVIKKKKFTVAQKKK